MPTVRELSLQGGGISRELRMVLMCSWSEEKEHETRSTSTFRRPRRWRYNNRSLRAASTAPTTGGLSGDRTLSPRIHERWRTDSAKEFSFLDLRRLTSDAKPNKRRQRT